VPSQGESGPLQFPSCEYSVVRESCAYADKDTVRFRSGLKCHTKHSLLSVKSVLFSHRTLFFRTHIYWHGLVVTTATLQAIPHARRHQRVTSTSAHFDCLRVANTTSSQKSEDRDVTDITVNDASVNQSARNAIASSMRLHFYCLLRRFIHAQIRCLCRSRKKIQLGLLSFWTSFVVQYF
jgi:hypothetical protein